MQIKQTFVMYMLSQSVNFSIWPSKTHLMNTKFCLVYILKTLWKISFFIDFYLVRRGMDLKNFEPINGGFLC